MKAKLIRAPDRQERPLPTSAYMEVTPALAQEWLDTAGRNRTVHETWVDRYAHRMERGDWMVTDQGIAFNVEGQLMNGQHRLHAVIRANRPVTMLVTRGLDSRAQLVMDQGVKRQLHEQIAIREGWEVTPMHIAVAKVMIDGIGVDTRNRRLIKADPQLLDRFYLRHHAAIEWTVFQFGRHSSVRGVTIAPVMGPVARAYYHEDHDDLMRFADIVTTGMSEHKNDLSAIALRNWLIAGRERGVSARKSGNRDNAYRKTEIALRAFLSGKQVERLGQMQLDKELWVLPEETKPREVVRAT